MHHVYVFVQVLIRYGRQRWKLRGKVEINAKQLWDNEEIVFLPLVNEYFSVKVHSSHFQIIVSSALLRLHQTFCLWSHR